MMRRAVMMTMVAVALGVGACAKPGDPKNLGREVVLTASMPKDIVAKFNAFVPEARKPGQTALDALADPTEKWRLPNTIAVTPTGNPYVIAIRVTGRVTGDDGAVTLWHGTFERADGDGPVLLRPIAGLNAPKGGAKGDGRFERTGGSAPVSFKEDGRYYPVVELQRKSGLTIESVEAEVWSGLPKPTWIEMLFGWQGALVGLFMLVFWWFMFRKRD